MDEDDWNDMDRFMSGMIGRRWQRGFKRLQQDQQALERLLTGRKRDSPDLSPSERMKSQFVSIPQTENESVKSAPPPMDFAATEWGQVETAYQSGLEEEQSIKTWAKDVPRAIRDIRRFLKLWNQMSPLAQSCLGEDDSADIYEGNITRYRIEGRARDALLSLVTSKGRPAGIANMQVTEVLAGLWRARGNAPKPGRIYSDKKSGRSFGSDYSPNPFVKFVASALRHLDPSLKNGDLAARRAKSAVDALHKEGRL